MALKINLKKAYDKLEWGFIRGMLIRYHFPDNLIEIIMSCISSVLTSLLFKARGSAILIYLYSLYGTLKPAHPRKVQG